MKKYLIILLFCFLGTYCFAQTNNFSYQDREEFQERVGRMLDVFQNRLSLIARKDRSIEVKREYVKQTLNMFIGEGEAYIDPDGYERPAVTMEVSSLRNKIPRKIPLKRYLNNLMNLTYTKVEIKQAQTYYVSNWRQEGDYYVATATIFQEFIGYREIEGRVRPAYRDVTSKTIKIYLILDEDLDGQKWVIKFGDISVRETTT